MIKKRLALFIYENWDSEEKIAVAMQCEIVGYTRISEWKTVEFNEIGEENESKNEIKGRIIGIADELVTIDGC